MPFKYSLKDEESNLLIGHFEFFCGLPSMELKNNQNDDMVHLKLKNFHFTNEFREYCTNRRHSISNLYFLVLDKCGFVIGSYYFVLNSRKRVINSELIDDQDVILEGYLPTGLFQETIALWDLWNDYIPNKYDIWLNFSELQCDIWMGIIRNNCNTSANSLQHQDKTNQTYYLNGRNITDVTKFYFLLGESINGPGGYFGGCLDSLSDCLCGGFGVMPPFTIELSGYANKSIKIEKILQVLREHRVTIKLIDK